MNLKQLLVFDAEWVPMVNSYDELTKYPEHKQAWDNRCKKWNADKTNKGESNIFTPSEYWDKAAFGYPEFCKIICISMGYTNKNNEFVTISYYGHDEKDILEKFNTLLISVETKGMILAGAAIKRYDMPWLAKRMMVNGIAPSKLLNVYGKKPWDVIVYDIMEAWGQGCSQESYTPFECIAVSLGVESPKNDISGADVKRVYWEDGDIERIKTYCEGDVKQTMAVITKLIEYS
jgi:predicted PolB exonuclease-like 3'-5' exonuclease